MVFTLINVIAELASCFMAWSKGNNIPSCSILFFPYAFYIASHKKEIGSYMMAGQQILCDDDGGYHYTSIHVPSAVRIWYYSRMGMLKRGN